MALSTPPIHIGAIYLDNCEGRSIIPKWLIVFGSVSVVQTVIDIVKRCFRTKRNDDEEGSVRFMWHAGVGCYGLCVDSDLLMYVLEYRKEC